MDKRWLLLQPARLPCQLTLRNRVVVTAHGTGLSENGVPGEKLIAYHRARAHGGVGLIITEHNSVHPTSLLQHGTTVCNWDDRIVAPYRSLADAVHSEGSMIFAQLAHAGLQSHALPDLGYVVGPSDTGILSSAAPVHVLSGSELTDLSAAYGEAAMRVRAGGLDGVEIHLGHGNLLQQFLSPLTNDRDDGYGGSDANRLRFPLEVLRAVLAAVPGFPIGLRVSADELVPGGLDTPAMIAIVKALVSDIPHDSIAYINVSAGQDMVALSAGLHQSGMYVPHGHLLTYARAFKGAFPSVPTICIGRITSPELAEKALADGDADLVGMTRAHIADPNLVAKVEAGRIDEIVPCIGCNIACLGRLERGLHISCVQNPASGRETMMEHIPARRGQIGSVVVIGGGPAGLEAAVTGARMGHRVTLFERSSRLGGQILLQALLPGREEVLKVIEVRERLLDRFGVDVRLGMSPSLSDIVALSPDLVVVATGSHPRSHATDEPPWTDLEALLRGDLDAESVFIHDEVGEVAGAGLAEALGQRGREVVLAYPAERPMNRVERGMRAVILQRVGQVGAKVRTNISLAPYHGVWCASDVLARERLEIRVDTAMVLVRPRRAAPTMLDELRASGLSVAVVGDALAPRGMENAILDARLALEASGAEALQAV